MQRDGGDDYSRHLPIVVSAIFLGVLLVVGFLYASNSLNSDYPWINHDVGYHTYLGLEMLEGSRLYVDLKECNPPGSVLLLAALIGLNDAVGLPDFLLQHGFVLLLGLLGFAVLRTALSDPEDDLLFALVGLAYLIVLVRGNFSNNLFPAAPDIPYDFGQREHLFSLLFLPYLIHRLSKRTVPRALYPYLVALGFVAVFKPYWPLLVAAVEAYRLRERPAGWQLAPGFLAVGMVLPFLLLLLHSAESFTRFFTENIPMYFRSGYDHYDTSLAEFAGSALHLQMLGGWLLLIFIGIVCLRRGLIRPRTAVLLFALAALAHLSVLHQHKFWSYHTMTFFGLSVVPGALLLATAIRGQRSTALRASGALAAILITLFAVGATILSTAKMLRDYPPLDHALVRLIDPHPRTMFFSMSVSTAYAPLLLRREMIGRWPVFLDLPELLAIPDRAQREAALEEYAGRVRRVLAAERPDLLVFSPNRQALYGRTLYDTLVGIGAVSTEGYRRVPRGRLLAISPLLDDWVVYERDPTRPDPR